MTENLYRRNFSKVWDNGFEAGRRAEAQRLHDALLSDAAITRADKAFTASRSKPTVLALRDAIAAALDPEVPDGG